MTSASHTTAGQTTASQTTARPVASESTPQQTSAARPVPARKFRNAVLNALDARTISALDLRPIRFEVGHELEFPAKLIEHVFFLEEGMASLTTTFKDGSQVEVGMFGFESVIGVSALMGSKRSLNRVYTQIAGSGYSCPLQCAQGQFRLGGTFQVLCLRFVQTQLLQAMQSAGCNAKHDVVQRLARWLLLCADRVNSTRFLMSHEFLSDMLGSRRSTVTIAAGTLKREKLIKYSRGLITILDPAGLEQRACECYGVVLRHIHDFTEFDSSIVS